MQKKARLSLTLTSHDLVKVKQGDLVSPGDVLIAPSELLSTPFDLPQLLGVAAHKIPKHLTRSENDFVAVGDVLATKKNLFSKKHVKAPESGSFVFVDRDRGLAAIKQVPTGSEIVSWFSGEVEELTPEKLVLSVMGLPINGDSGVGHPTSGLLFVSGEVTDLMHVPTDIEDMVLAIPNATSEIFAKAAALGVRAIVTNSLPSGASTMPHVVIKDMQSLTKFHGHQVIVYGNEQQLLVLEKTPPTQDQKKSTK